MRPGRWPSAAMGGTGRRAAGGGKCWCGSKEGRSCTWQAHTNTVSTLAFSLDGRALATGSWDGAIKLWDVGEEGSRRVRETLAGHTNKVRAIAWRSCCIAKMARL